MIKIFKNVFRAAVFPFILVYKIIIFPYRVIKGFLLFLNTEPEDHPLSETVVRLTTDAEARQAFWLQVEDLRFHLLRILIGIAIAVSASFYFTISLMDYLAKPIGGLTQLQAIEVTEEIGVYMRVALTSGITLALPYIVFEVWYFVATGLRAREKKLSLLAIPLATLLFVGGVVFTHRILIPAALPFLGGFTQIAQFWTAKEYFGFITGLMLWIGLFFEFPLAVFVLAYLGIIEPKVLLQQWRLAIVVIALLAAAVTPTVDPVNMSLVMLPMVLLYFVGLLLSYIAVAVRRRRNLETENSKEQEQVPP